MLYQLEMQGQLLTNEGHSRGPQIDLVQCLFVTKNSFDLREQRVRTVRGALNSMPSALGILADVDALCKRLFSATKANRSISVWNDDVHGGSSSEANRSRLEICPMATAVRREQFAVEATRGIVSMLGR